MSMWFKILIFIGFLTACASSNDLEDRVFDLESRVIQLENDLLDFEEFVIKSLPDGCEEEIPFLDED